MKQKIKEKKAPEESNNYKENPLEDAQKNEQDTATSAVIKILPWTVQMTTVTNKLKSTTEVNLCKYRRKKAKKKLLKGKNSGKESENLLLVISPAHRWRFFSNTSNEMASEVFRFSTFIHFKFYQRILIYFDFSKHWTLGSKNFVKNMAITSDLPKSIFLFRKGFS